MILKKMIASQTFRETFWKSPKTEFLKKLAELPPYLLSGLSVKSRCLDFFLVGTAHSWPGLDFFSIPNSFISAIRGRPLFQPGLNYGPYQTWFYFHPAVTYLFGSWISVISPWTAYWIFVALSLLILRSSVEGLQSVYQDSKTKEWLTAILVFSPPTYLMLWNGQVHVFLIAAAAAVCIGVRRYQLQFDKYERWIICGLLVSLMTKPLALLWVSALLTFRPFRRAVIISLLSYVGISLAFLWVRSLGGGGLVWIEATTLHTQSQIMEARSNLAHWLVIWSNVSVFEFVMTGHEFWEMFSLPTLVAGVFGIRFYRLFFLAPTLLYFVLCGLSLWLKSRVNRVDSTLLLILIGTLSYFLAYPIVWEYQYAILPVFIPVCVALRRRAKSSAESIGYLFVLVGLASVILPTPYCFFKEHTVGNIILVKGWRVFPIVIEYVILVGLWFRCFTFRKSEKS